MEIHIDLEVIPPAVVLHGAEDFRSFKVVVRPMPHTRVPVAVLEQLAGSRADDPEWQNGLAKTDFAFSDHVLPAGSWIYLLNAAANRDERHYPDPDRFLVARNPRDQLSWGYGAHLCAGMHLTRLEMEILLGALVRSVRTIEAGAPTRLINTGLQGYQRLPLTLHPL